MPFTYPRFLTMLSHNLIIFYSPELHGLKFETVQEWRLGDRLYCTFELANTDACKTCKYCTETCNHVFNLSYGSMEPRRQLLEILRVQ